MTARCQFCQGRLWAEQPDPDVRVKGPLVLVLVCGHCSRPAEAPAARETCAWDGCQRFPTGEDRLCTGHRAMLKQRETRRARGAS